MVEQNSHEIDILSLIGKVAKQWRKLIIFAIVGAVIGVVVALCTPKSYKAEVTLAPEVSSGGLGLNDNLADMASNFGIDLGSKSSMDAIYPEIYPDVFATTDFVMALYNVPVRLAEDNTQKTYIEHLRKDTKTPFWNYPKAWLSELMKPKDKGVGKGGKADPFRISRTDWETNDAIKHAIQCTVDKKTSIISITVVDQDPLVATILADTLQHRLQEYITNYRTKKARNDYEYYKKLALQLKRDYDRSRNSYTTYADANTDVILKSYEEIETELENDMQSKYDNYKSTLALMRQAHAKIQENTPAFVVMERPIMPYKASSTPRIAIVILWMFLGILAGSCWVLYKGNHSRNL